MIAIKDVLTNYQKACEAKASNSCLSLFFKACFAGAMIGFGGAAGNVASHAIADVGVGRMAAASVFPVGLMMILFMGAELFTGDCMVTLGVAGKNISVLQALKILLCVFFGNMLGSTILCFLIFHSGQYNYSAGLLGAFTIKVALGKCTMSFGSALASGILCNFLVCAAVLMANASSTAVGKIWAAFFVIFLFVISGYEHCVANMYYITAGLFAKTNPAYVNKAMEVYGYTADQLDKLNLYGYFVKNLIPVTLGNFIGGGCVLALSLLFLNRAKKEK